MMYVLLPCNPDLLPSQATGMVLRNADRCPRAQTAAEPRYGTKPRKIVGLGFVTGILPVSEQVGAASVGGWGELRRRAHAVLVWVGRKKSMLSRSSRRR